LLLSSWDGKKVIIAFKRRKIMRMGISKRGVAVTLMLVFALLAVGAGCTSTLQERRMEPVVGEQKGVGKYYHFDDVLVPNELNYDQKRSFIYETPRFKTGVLMFTKYRVDIESLINFFTYHMEKHNWKLVNSFRGKESVLNFSKPDRTCAIRITEAWTGMSDVEIRVGPVSDKKM
jgi:hypothetical protein